MGLRICFILLLFFLLLGIATPSFMDYDRVEKGRSLLSRAPNNTDCPFDVSKMNYTIVTSQCKGEPEYTVKLCCPPFKELTCKYRDDLNAVDKNTCAVQMWNHLHNHGYPSGLFEGLCKEGKQGLDCLGY
ncbi:PREDICTED: GPI-anchored protein LLG2-like isoform X2 [Ipomoea nil]|uniref:GPI-anchored protein LLG2-like isoform X2 n=1 Tax=Ipomoea nil TaxID=35883 RepID=UPI0009012C9F|nr:PREDICTED: GPI-anchored protein LLG2-like isoform X2 [Ipomoea nil]